jgi:hypothetical protein
MENQVIAPALSDEERTFLYDQRNSEHFRLFAKAITWAYSLEAAKLVTATQVDLPRIQGVLQGLLSARGVIMTQGLTAAPTEQDFRKRVLNFSQSPKH